ncbi:hypothetical protein [Shewanella sp. Arc9-LZ]|uniref:hypothetical protein n=1 Tax=Shewanella sp. Arc9-LZ TaxID=2698686 RepID=UPI00137B9ABA|nr:hypothetical protein [Shewanella sp. Arc9-LZ]QHS12691.1 hypothetical protein GUY17_05930 [Shewanella sp. Arc9-LZ]
MLYGLKAIEDHPCFKMHDLLENLFFEYVSDKDFSDVVFRNIFSKKYINGHGKAFKKSLDDLVHSLPTNKAKKQKLYSQFVNNNSIEALCLEKGFIPESYIRWTDIIGVRLNGFLLNCYETKLDLSPFKRPDSSLKPTHSFYQEFIIKNGGICPFCGLNAYKNVFGSRREDLDHYLFKGKYPFAAANMWNLVPTCSECNQDYKKTKDVLFDAGVRTEAYYPYRKIGGVNLKVNLNIGFDNKTPDAWNIHITPKIAAELKQVENWVRIYGITRRYKNEIAAEHDNWIMTELLERGTVFVDTNGFRRFMISRARVHKKLFEKKLAPKSFLKTSFFVFVARYADDAFIGKYMLPFNAGL